MLTNYTMTHCHSDLSNGIMTDSATSFKKYIKLAKENNMTAIAFSEHGNVYNWILKKMACDEAGIKYIHGQEFYVTATLETKIKDAYHLGMYAKNWDGVKELNKLSSIAFNKEDNHFYYRPRISLDEVMNTSDNIIITTACLASLLWSEKDDPIAFVFLNWMSKNKHRCFLEIQYHECEEQKQYNQLLYQWHKEYGIPLIAGTDTHSATELEAELRTVLQKSKNIGYSDEDVFDLTFKTYDELVKMFVKQDVLPINVYMEAIANTNVLANMVEDFQLDKSHKYPKISDNSKNELQYRIIKGIKRRKIGSWEQSKKLQYLNRVKEEFEVFEQLGMLDYILLLDNISIFCKENNISVAPRGSCNGSLVLWILGVTDVDSIKFDLPFFRFCNPSRVSLGDVDLDLAGDKRPLVKDFLYNYKGINGSAIITLQTYALRGAVRGISRGLGIPLDEIEAIADDISEIEEEDEYTGESKKTTTFHNKEKWEQQYPKLLELAYRVIGTIENVSVHACGFVATDRNIHEEIGTFQTDNSKWIVSQNNMKAIDAINFVKMDFLVVDNVQIVEDVCKLAGIPPLNNDTLDFEDMNVWNEMLKSGLGIFQFEKTGWIYLKHALENFDEFKHTSPSITRLDMMTALNGIIRPAGDSIREDFIKGKAYRSGMLEIDKTMESTLSYCIYQEDIMMWLYNFCGYDMAMADIVRRGIAKKGGTEKLVPSVREGFVKYCSKQYPLYSLEFLKEVCEKYVQIILSASNYGFSRNHSCPYSILGFKGAYLRHYYPLEYLTVQFNINEGKIEKTAKIYEFIHAHTNIQVKPIQFRKSKSNYACDKANNAIYKGIKSIKYLNERIADELFELGKRNYEDFVGLLVAITEETSVDSRQMKILLNLDFFQEFGYSSKLLHIYEKFEKRYKADHKPKTKIQRLIEIREFIDTIDIKPFTPDIKIQNEVLYLGYAQTTIPTVSSDYYMVIGLEKPYTHPMITLYQLNNGHTQTIKCKNPVFEETPFARFDILKVHEIKEDFKWKKKAGGKGFERSSEKEPLLTKYSIVK